MLLKVRYRSGVVGESRRSVHLASRIEDGRYRALCGQLLDPSEVEESPGMPCQSCLMHASLNNSDA